MTRTPEPVYLSATAMEAEATFLEFTGLAAATEGDQRTLSGMALPYGEKIRRPNWALGTEWLEFAPGAAEWRDNAQLFYGHDHLSQGLPIGRVLSSQETDKGSKVTAKVSETAKGTEVYTLAKDGVLDRFSVGFYTLAYEVLNPDTPDATMRVTQADIFEVSVVPDPAYKSAKVESVLANHREEHRNMKCDKCGQVHAHGVTECQAQTFASTEDVTTLGAQVENLARQIATLGQGSPGADDKRKAPADSYGEFLQKVAAGDTEALEFLAFAGSVVGDLDGYVKDAWVGDLYRQVNASRRLTNLFDRSPLPATGMSVEFGQVRATSNTMTVDKQAAEGDTLPYGKIAFAVDNAPVETYGGWSDMSRQTVERSGVAVVEKFFQALLNEYAKRTEAAVRAVVADPANSTALAGAGTHDLTTADGWLDFVIDAAMYFDDRGLPLEFLVVSGSEFKSLAHLRDGAASDAPRLLDRRTGTINVTGLSGEMFNLPVVPVSDASVGNSFVRAGHSSAVRTFEAGGAPFRLQDDDITNLTKAMSVYGYMAIADQDHQALVAPDATV